MKILYLYSGIRKDKFRGAIGIDYPDTQFYGLNHLSKFGIDAEYKEPRKLPGFRLRHFLMYFASRKYDIVFGPSIFYMMLWRKIFPAKAKFVLLNINLTRTLAANKGNFRLRIIRWLLKEIDAVVCLTNVQKEYLERYMPFLKGKLYFAPFGVDINYHKPVYGGRKKYILSAGRDNGRDYKTVIETARLMPNEEFHIVASRRNLIGIKEIPNNVRIFFDLSPKEVYGKYREAGILLLITHDDAFQDGSDCSGQTVLVEAMASGLPIIVSRKRYLRDYISDGKEALFVDFYKPVKIAEKIKFFNNTNIGLKLAKSARERAERDFSTKKMAEKLSKIFKSLCILC